MKSNVLILKAFLIIITLFPVLGNAQVDHLKKKMTCSISEGHLSEVLKDLEVKGDFYFSYDADIVDPKLLVSCNAANESLEQILANILPDHIRYRTIGRHVVLFEDPDNLSQELMVKGYITDARSNLPIIYASVYNPENNIMAASDMNGYYEMSLDNTEDRLTLVVSRSGYETNILHYASNSITQTDVNLKGVESEISGLSSKDPNLNSVNDRKMVKAFVPEKLIYLSENDQIYETNPYQFSIVPGVSTNGLKNSNSINNFSFNLLGGYSKGTNGLEVGCLINVDRSFVSGLQVAGFANYIGDSLKGAQVAGFSNYNGNNMVGIQLAGFGNVNTGDINGIQVAGFVNALGGNMYGSQLAGFTNLTRQSVDGLQLSGFANYSAKDVAIAQLSGFGNYATNNHGVQVAGFINIALDSVELGQVSGFTNYAMVNNGFQISGLFNYAYESHGVQVSLINYADSSSGIPIGFFSYVRSGYNVIELSIDEHFPVNLSFKTGINPFYNIFELGTDGKDLKASYGLGTLFYISPKWQFNTDLLFGTLLDLSSFNQSYSRYLLRLEPAFNFTISNKFSLAAGPALRIYGAEGDIGEINEPFSSYHFYEAQYDNWYLQYWLGAKFSLRFF